MDEVKSTTFFLSGVGKKSATAIWTSFLWTIPTMPFQLPFLSGAPPYWVAKEILDSKPKAFSISVHMSPINPVKFFGPWTILKGMFCKQFQAHVIAMMPVVNDPLFLTFSKPQCRMWFLRGCSAFHTFLVGDSRNRHYCLTKMPHTELRRGIQELSCTLQ